MKKVITNEKWDNLIEDHYLSALKNNPDYPKIMTKDEHKKWWYGLVERNNEEDVEVFIIGSTYCNNKGIKHHPV